MKIVKTKFLCKNTSQTATKGFPIYLQDRFIEGRWYDGEYETWSDQLYLQKKLFKLNGGWKRYWVVNEMGKKEEISKAHMDAIFEMDIDKLRDGKINEILK